MAYDITDPDVRAAAIAARAWGVPLGQFLGTTCESTTTYQYDAHGRLARAVTTTSSWWSDDDRQAAVDLAAWEADLCSGCHHPLSETGKPENEGQYEARLPIRCHFCTTAATAGDAYQQNQIPSALRFPIVRKEATA